MLRIPTLVGLAFIASAASAANFDNRSGRYSFTPLPSAEAEMKRMNTIMELSDQQPTGRYVRKGETVRVNVGGMPSGYRARDGRLPSHDRKLVAESAGRAAAQRQQPVRRQAERSAVHHDHRARRQARHVD